MKLPVTSFQNWFWKTWIQRISVEFISVAVDRVPTPNLWVKSPDYLQQDHPGSMQAFSNVRCPCNSHISLSPFDLKMFRWPIGFENVQVANELQTLRESFFSKIRNFWAWADKLGWTFMRHLGYFWPNYKHYFGTVSPLSMGKCSWFSFLQRALDFRSKTYNSQMLPK